MLTDHTNVVTAPAPAATDTRAPLEAHLVLRSEWPRALCGEVIAELVSGLGRDRCIDCLRIANRRGLRVTGWAA